MMNVRWENFFARPIQRPHLRYTPFRYSSPRRESNAKKSPDVGDLWKSKNEPYKTSVDLYSSMPQFKFNLGMVNIEVVLTYAEF